MRIQVGGSHTFAAAGTFVIRTEAAAKNLNIDTLIVTVRGTALASGISVAVQAGGNTVALLNPLLSTFFGFFTQPCVLGASQTLQLVAAGTTLAATIDYYFAGSEQ